MSIEFPNLPYAIDALEPYVSAKTLEFHHGKHHKGYVDKLNAAIQGTVFEGQDLGSIVTAAHSGGDIPVFNNAAQAWNHSFLWHSMSPQGGGEPEGPLAVAIEARFGSVIEFRAAFKAAALGQFGSGWAWLVGAETGLEIVTTGNADTPVVAGMKPLLTLDVWEHAYYLDYQNERNTYIDAFLSKIVNWDFAAQNYESDQAAA